MPFQTHKTFLLNLIELLNEVIIFVFFAYKKVFSTTVVTWTNNVLTTFLGLERGSCVAVYAGSESSRISSKIS